MRAFKRPFGGMEGLPFEGGPNGSRGEQLRLENKISYFFNGFISSSGLAGITSEIYV